MPSSRNNHIPTVINVVQQLKPASILDIGVGFGKWGFLFREYTDIIAAEHNPPRYQRENWQVVIDGIEGFSSYLTPVHSYVYNRVYEGDMRQVLPTLSKYDVIFMGDVIEHVDKSDGLRFLGECLSHSNKAVVISTPSEFVPQGDACGNSLEVHQSFWSESDFRLPGCDCLARHLDNGILLAVLLKPGVRHPNIAPASRKAQGRRKPLWRRVVRRLAKLPAKLRGTEGGESSRSFNSSDYWERRYAKGGNSGVGSYGDLAAFKAKVINGFVEEKDIRTVIEFGTGDGNQLSLCKFDRYVGIDVSHTVVRALRERFAGDATKEFYLREEFTSERQFDLSISLDVVYHLIDEAGFRAYMRDLFSAARRHVIVYSSNVDLAPSVPHVRDRNFTAFVAQEFPEWRLTHVLKNPHHTSSRADFFFFEKVMESVPNKTAVQSSHGAAQC